MLQRGSVDVVYVSFIAESSIKTEEVRLVIFKEFAGSFSEGSIFRHAPVEVSNLLVVSLEELEGVEVLGDDSFEGVSLLELGEERLKHGFVLNVESIIALESSDS